MFIRMQLILNICSGTERTNWNGKNVWTEIERIIEEGRCLGTEPNEVLGATASQDGTDMLSCVETACLSCATGRSTFARHREECLGAPNQDTYKICRFGGTARHVLLCNQRLSLLILAFLPQGSLLGRA